MTDLELLIDFHVDAERQGPWSDADTLKALNLIDIINPEESVKFVDIGCGSGAQTLTLAQHINGRITAVDLFPDFLTKLNYRAEKLNLKNKISTLEKSMEELPFDDEEYDILWSEGAIYNIGFESGIKNWKRFLKTNGYIAVSEITWKTKNRPKEIALYTKYKDYLSYGFYIAKKLPS